MNEPCVRVTVTLAKFSLNQSQMESLASEYYGRTVQAETAGGAPETEDGKIIMEFRGSDNLTPGLMVEAFKKAVNPFRKPVEGKEV